jgi:hypothetical protein
MKKQSLKLGTETGSFFNYLMGNTQSLPEVGKGATILYWSDRDAYEVLNVSADRRRVLIQAYKVKRIDNLGMSDQQEYAYDELAGIPEWIVFKYNSWRYENTGGKLNIIFGVKKQYYDFSF